MGEASQPSLWSMLKDYIPYLLSLLSGFAIAIFTEPIRKKIWGPQLSIVFTGQADCISKTIETLGPVERDAYYIKARVTNISKAIARDCRVHLINIEKKDEDGEFKPTIYSDSIQLAWSCQHPDTRFKALDLAKGVRQYVDIITTRSGILEYDPQLFVKPYRYLPLITDTGIFRFTLQVLAAGADPKTLRVVFEWDSSWDSFRAYTDS
jgi:hypothetical protein